MVINKNKTTIVLAMLLLMSGMTFAGGVYVPAPIVFVHGLNSNDDTWNYTKSQLEKYFIDDQTGELKYEYTGISVRPYSYFPFCTYEWMNTGDIPTIADDLLSTYIWAAQQNIPEDCPNKKVNIVAHSMGGLVTRSLLRQRSEFQNSINRVVFVGTPHTGSPQASALWLLNKVKEEVLPTKIEENRYYALTAFTGNEFAPNDRKAYENLLRNLLTRYANIITSLGFAEATGLDPQSPAIEQLRLNQDVSYYDVIFGQAGDRLKTVELTANHSGSETFLAAGNNNLTIPNNYKSIVGKNTFSNIFMGYGMWGLGKILGHGDAFIFPAGESLDDISVYGGDGVVSIGSQSDLGNAVIIDDIDHLEEPRQWQAILDALDDSPVIEDIYVVSADKYANGSTYPVYVVVKVKDYLLADIAIESIKVNDNPLDLSVILSDFDDGEGQYKPYVKFGKNFLKERQDWHLVDKDWNIMTLTPGEFYVQIDLEGDDSHAVDINLRNPSTNPSTPKSLTIQRPTITDEQPTGTIGELRPTIQARIYSPPGVDIDLDSLEIMLDNIPVSHNTSGSGSDIIISYTPSDDLDRGEHTVKLNGRDTNGLPTEEIEWSFTIVTSGYFEIEVPPKIYVNQNFDMTITAYNGYGEIMDGLEGRELYDEDVSITISGDPSPQGNLLITQANAGEWTNGIWHVTNQRYVNSTEEKYKLTITVDDTGGVHSEMTGENCTIVNPLELSLVYVGHWATNHNTGDWSGFSEGGYTEALVAGACYDYSYSDYGDTAWGEYNTCYWGLGKTSLHKIVIPPGSNIGNIDLVLRRYDYDLPIFKWVGYNTGIYLPPSKYDYPPNISAEINIDYSFTSHPDLSRPMGSYNLLHEVMGGIVYRSDNLFCDKLTHSYLQENEIIIKTISLDNPSIETVWISSYVPNIQSMVEQVRPHATINLQQGQESYNWEIKVNAEYIVDSVHGY